MADAVCMQRLIEARDALHQLMIGATVVSVSYEGRSRTFRQSSGEDINKLRVYILELQNACGGPGGEPLCDQSRSYRVEF